MFSSILNYVCCCLVSKSCAWFTRKRLLDKKEYIFQMIWNSEFALPFQILYIMKMDLFCWCGTWAIPSQLCHVWHAVILTNGWDMFLWNISILEINCDQRQEYWCRLSGLHGLQESFWVWDQPMRGDVTLLRCLSLAEPIPRMILGSYLK